MMSIIKKVEFAKNDQDLYSVLTQANEKELELLSSIIAGKNSASIEKTERDAIKITSEIQLYGADTSVSLFRGHGVCYNEILRDVAGKLGVKHTKDEAVIDIEGKVVDKLWGKYKKTLSETDRAELEAELDKISTEHAGKIKYALKKEQNAFLPLIAAIGMLLVKRGAVNAIPFLGQVIAVIMTLLSVVTVFTSPAYKVTIPCVFIIACIRARIIMDSREAELDV